MQHSEVFVARRASAHHARDAALGDPKASAPIPGSGRAPASKRAT